MIVMGLELLNGVLDHVTSEVKCLPCMITNTGRKEERNDEDDAN